MRFLVLPIAIAGLAFAADPSPVPPRPLVILVHGRGHIDTDTAALRREWKAYLDSALKTVGMPRLRDEDVRLAWYADVLDPESEGSCIQVGTHDSLSLGAFFSVFLGSLASALPKEESRDARGILGELMYAMDESKRCAAERRVGSVIESAIAEKRPVIVVAYSLGSLVTFGYLNSRQVKAKHAVDLRLITLGSPLGIRAVREMVLWEADSLRMPADVSTWENIYDPDDFFSAPLQSTLRSLKVHDRVVDADPDADVHGIARYLRDRATGSALKRALCATAKDELFCRATPTN